MKNMKYILNRGNVLLRLFISIFLFFGILSCQKVFDYSIYSSDVPTEYKDTRKQNVEKLAKKEAEDLNNETVCFALISDSHSEFDDLENVINAINADSSIEFVIVGGDITDGGILDEYLIFRYIMGLSEIPYFTVIGNHDCLANGLSIYQDVYGADNYVLNYKNCKFVFFNDVVWELNYQEPDFLWFKTQLENSEDNQNVFAVSHIPPWSDSYTPLMQYAFTSIIDSANVMLSIHGHHHDYSYGDHYDDGNNYLVIGSVAKKHYIKMTVNNNSYTMERIEF